MTPPLRNLELRSLVTRAGELELSRVETDVAMPERDQVVVRVEAAPINLSDLALLLGPADAATARAQGKPERPIVTATAPPARPASKGTSANRCPSETKARAS